MAEDVSVVDVEAELLSLLLEGATELADAGRGARACEVAAAAWSALEPSRPDLAAKVTAALHRLARSTDDAAVTVDHTPGTAAGNGRDPALDVRPLAPAQRHEAIFEAYAALRPGTGFVLVNDHDPKPLRYQFEAEHARAFTWDVLEAGPQVWRVRIGRVPAEASR